MVVSAGQKPLLVVLGQYGSVRLLYFAAAPLPLCPLADAVLTRKCQRGSQWKAIPAAASTWTSATTPTIIVG